MKAINPATNELIKEYKEHTENEVLKIVEASHNEFLKWRKVSFSERSKLMRNAADVLRKNVGLPGRSAKLGGS